MIQPSKASLFSSFPMGSEACRLRIEAYLAMHTFLFQSSKRLCFLRACLLAALGCVSSTWGLAQSASAATESTNQPPTYLRDILPIIMGKCSRCHNEQARFVYNWLDYRTAFADRWEIKRRVWDAWKGTYFKESMPIANSPESLALTDEERLTIRNWVTEGAALGVAPPPGAP